MRRATLGFPNAARNGPALPPGRAMSQMGGSQQDRRSSALPFGNGRRSSVMSTTSRAGSSRRGTMQSSKDPRPRNDKPYMAQCIKLIVEFVIENGYGEPISAKILSNPTSKDFQNIFSFMLSINVPFTFHKRFDEDVPVVLKFLGYPFSLSKSALTAVGSPHTWPTLLGTLYWIYELLKYGEKAAKVREADAPTFAEGRQAVFHEDLIKAYGDFLDGVDDYEELNREIEAKFADRSAQNRAEVDALAETTRQRAEQLENFKSNPSPLQEVSDEHRSLEENNKKWSYLIACMIDNLDEVQKRVQDKEARIAEQHTVFGTHKEEQMRLASVLDTQEKNSINAEEIVHKRAELKRATEHSTSEENLAEEDVRFVSDDVEKMTAEFKQLHHQYEQNAQYLSSSLRALDSAPAVDFRLRFNDDEGVTAADEVLSADIDGTITPALQRINELFGAEILRLKDEELRLQVSLDDMELQQVQKRELVARLQGEYTRTEAEFQQDKEMLADGRQKRANDNVEGEDALSARRREDAERLAECQKREEHFIDQWRKMGSQFEEEKRRVALMVLEDVEVARERKGKMLRLISSLGGEGRSTLPPTMPR